MSATGQDPHVDPRQDPNAAVDVLLQALPYIEAFRGTVVVVKFGGNAMVDPELFESFASDVVWMHRVGIKPVVVHGGGPQIGAWMERLGRESTFVDGLRVTDDEIDGAAVSPEVDAAIDDAIAHLRAFNERQLERFDDWSFESEPGLTVGERISPITSVEFGQSA